MLAEHTYYYLQSCIGNTKIQAYPIVKTLNIEIHFLFMYTNIQEPKDVSN